MSLFSLFPLLVSISRALEMSANLLVRKVDGEWPGELSQLLLLIFTVTACLNELVHLVVEVREVSILFTSSMWWGKEEKKISPH